MRVTYRGSRVEGRGSRVIFLKKLILKILAILNKYITLVHAVHLLSTFSPCACLLAFEVIFLDFILSFSPYGIKSRALGYEVSFNPPGNGDCFYASAAKALKIETQSLKKVVFDFLKSDQFDVSIQRLKLTLGRHR